MTCTLIPLSTDPQDAQKKTFCDFVCNKALETKFGYKAHPDPSECASKGSPLACLLCYLLLPLVEHELTRWPRQIPWVRSFFRSQRDFKHVCCSFRPHQAQARHPVAHPHRGEADAGPGREHPARQCSGDHAPRSHLPPLCRDPANARQNGLTRLVLSTSFVCLMGQGRATSSVMVTCPERHPRLPEPSVVALCTTG